MKTNRRGFFAMLMAAPVAAAMPKAIQEKPKSLVLSNYVSILATWVIPSIGSGVYTWTITSPDTFTITEHAIYSQGHITVT